MAKSTLPTNYKDDILNAAMNGKRRYNQIPNDDGTFSLDDATVYDQAGSDFGAGQVNEMNRNINESADAGKIIDDPDVARVTSQPGYIAGVQLFKKVDDSLQANGTQFYFDHKDGKYGFNTDPARGADTFSPFSGSIVSTDYVYSSRINETASFYNLQAEYTVQSKGAYIVELVSCEAASSQPVITVTKNSETISDYTSEDRGKIPNAVASSYFMRQIFIKLDCEVGDIINAINSNAYIFVMIVHKL